MTREMELQGPLWRVADGGLKVSEPRNCTAKLEELSVGSPIACTEDL